MPETCPKHSSLDKGSEVKGSGFEDEPSNLKFVDGRMQIYPKAIQEVDENIRRIEEESKLHNPDTATKPTPTTDETKSQLAPFLEMVAKALKSE